MAKRLDLINVIDLECSCWDGKPPGNEVQEIIEVGITVFDHHSLSLVDKESILVKPSMSKVSPFCHELTTLTQEQLDEEGIDFVDALVKLRGEYDSKNRTWASWGDFDRRMFQRQCSTMGLTYPFGPTHLNVKNLFALRNNLSREVGMSQALDIMELELQGTHHRGADDAWNIARLMKQLLS